MISLHPQLAKDSEAVCSFELSELRLINDSRFLWLILVPQREKIAEWFELESVDQQQLHEETMRVADMLKAKTRCSKVNIGAIGNIVRQLHVHVIARNENDDCWPRPVWGTPMEAMRESEFRRRIKEVRDWFIPNQ